MISDTSKILKYKKNQILPSDTSFEQLVQFISLGWSAFLYAHRTCIGCSQLRSNIWSFVLSSPFLQFQHLVS